MNKPALGVIYSRRWSFSLNLSSFSLILTAALAPTHVGCGGKEPPKDRTTVSGIVTFDGQPLPGGSLSFESAAGTGTNVSIGPGGVYSTDRAPIGKNRVRIETESLQYGNAAAYVKIPAKYNDVTKSGLQIDVKPGVNENVDFKLEK
jgi:hypothetical protein